ncbi:hypothetical protein L0775_004057 [Clostridioides difficile]|nr:hypothetical protein [Clostridioides difficile]EIS9627558.1 hypothetical protein [Clostridioides difficile]
MMANAIGATAEIAANASVLTAVSAVVIEVVTSPSAAKQFTAEQAKTKADVATIVDLFLTLEKSSFIITPPIFFIYHKLLSILEKSL